MMATVRTAFHYPAPPPPMPALRRMAVAGRSAALLLATAALLAGCGRQATRPTAAATAGHWPQVVPADPARANAVTLRALSLVGTPYRYGGNTPEGGFDCSGLVNYVFRTTLGIELPRVSREMASNGEKVDRASLVAGDLVFFGRRGKRVDHVGIYVGDGQFVHAPRTGRDVTVSRLDTGYWSGRFLQARRVEGLEG